MENLWQDLRSGFRALLGTPGFTAITALTLALGIGANTAIFSVVNAVLLKPLPYAQPEGLVYVFRMQPPVARSPVSTPAYRDFESQQKVFDVFAAHYGETYNLTGVDEAERIIGRRVTASFFTLFGVSPLRGRFIEAADDKPDSSRVAVISHSLWHRRFGSDPALVGRNVTLNGETYSVIGIAPPQFQFPGRVEIWTPAMLEANNRGRGSNFLMMIGRLKDGVSKEKAEAQMKQIAASLARQYPANHNNLTIMVSPMLEEQVRNIRSTLWIMLGAVGFVLLIAAANVANLLLARATARGREFAIRSALGASAWRILRQLLIESMMLALLGGAMGVGLAYWGVNLLVTFAPPNLPRAREVGLDRWVFGFTLLVSLITGILFGLAPAWQVARVKLNEILKEGSRGVSGGLVQSRLRRGLVVTEIAMSLVLLVSAGLLIGSIQRLLAVNPGFDTSRLLIADISYPRKPDSANLQNEEGERQILRARAAFLREAEQKVATLPGVESVGVINDLPVTSSSSMNGNFKIVGQPDTNWADAPGAEFRFVTPDYFKAIGIPLLKGRVFSERDTFETPINILINEALARRFFPNEVPIGKSLIVIDNKPHEIICYFPARRATKVDPIIALRVE